MTGFAQGLGRWAGAAEVFDGAGRFLGNAADQRRVQDLGEGRVRIDVAFVGPFKHAGHYFIHDHGDHRLYQGPANVGYAETLAVNLVDANAYWAALGLSQRFFLMVLPDGATQLSLAQMARGDRLLYAVVGQNERVADGDATAWPGLVSGTAHDLAADPAAGRGALLLHRPGEWVGPLTILDAARQPAGTAGYRECVTAALRVSVAGGGFAAEPHDYSLVTDGWQAWTPAGSVVGSYSLSGGRALSGDFHYLAHGLRVWRREVVTHDGARKAVVQHWYRGGARIGSQFGVLEFTAA